MKEAALRHAPVLLLGDRRDSEGEVDELQRALAHCQRRYPSVHIYPIANSADVAHFLQKHDERVQLAVIGGDDANKLGEIVGPTGHPIFHHTDSSVLVVGG
jgi:hypothetical protein